VTSSVLIVDDSLTVRMDLADAFTAAGFKALPCASMAEARARLAETQVDLAILDVLLPDGDGLELLRELRAEYSLRLPVMMLSSEADIGHRILGLSTGADAYLGKPYDTSYVITKARSLLAAGATSLLDSTAVLVIDDSPTLRAELERALSEDGYDVVLAASGEEGLRLMASQRPSAVIVDGGLPGIDGPTVIRRIRLDSALRRIPCILLTADQAAGAELRALESGADAFVRKDEDLAVIRARLRALLRQAGAVSDNTESLLDHKQILAVDDSPTYRAELALTLRSEGYDVVQAESGEQAIDLLAVQSVDCILLDLIMPGIGGKETCRRLKSSPLVRDIPVIVLTGIEDRNAMLEGLSLGADDYIQKSAEFEVLKARVRAQLRRKQFEEETRKVRERLLRSEMEASEARAAHELAETRAKLVEELAHKNQELQAAYQELQTTQMQLVQSAKMASLGELVAGVAHEINNPLSFAISHLSTARKSLERLESSLPDGIPERGHDDWQRGLTRLAEMGIGLERIRELVVKLRTFSRLDEGARKWVSVREAIESMLTILHHRLGRIQVATEFGEPDRIECSPGLLNQAIMNLVSNAIDAIEDAGTISLRTGAVGGHFAITVSDDGKGISSGLRERVFEPFFTTKPVGQGTGLGLSIAYSIVRAHGGSLELLERPEGGTQAIVKLPLSAEREP
jgi:two-component system, NtrC family, sensor kinase